MDAAASPAAAPGHVAEDVPCFFLVDDGGEDGGDGAPPPPPPPPLALYTRAALDAALQVAGLKPRLARGVADQVFLRLRAARRGGAAGGPARLRRAELEALVLGALRAAGGGSPAAAADLRAACALREGRAAAVVLLCGTSGSGKSTLAALLAARLGARAVFSTDSLRQLQLAYAAGEPERALLRRSTYDAAAALPGGAGGAPAAAAAAVVAGFRAQAAAVAPLAARLVLDLAARRRSAVVEGVHLEPALAVELMAEVQAREGAAAAAAAAGGGAAARARHPPASPGVVVVPFFCHISNAAKHAERFAVRAKAMTLRPSGNRWVAGLAGVRAVQAHLAAGAAAAGVPALDNTNVDRSLAAMHATVRGCLRAAAEGRPLVQAGAAAPAARVAAEFEAAQAAGWRGAAALSDIRRRRAEGGGGAAGDGPSTSAASTPRAPLSAAGGSPAPPSLAGSDDDEAPGAGGEALVEGSVVDDDGEGDDDERMGLG